MSSHTIGQLVNSSVKLSLVSCTLGSFLGFTLIGIRSMEKKEWLSFARLMCVMLPGVAMVGMIESKLSGKLFNIIIDIN